MSTYAIGDVQGCREQLEALLELINFDPANDRLWFAGDLVNRGPDSLGTLRLIYSIKESVIAVLGNHDLHMLAVNVYPQRANRKDTFFDVLDATDKEPLLDWLLHCPLAHAEDEYLMVHAGIYPHWDRHSALQYAAEVEQCLQGGKHENFFSQMYGNQPANWSEQLTGNDRLRFITNVLTRMRYCYDDSSLDMQCKGPVTEATPELTPWFDVTDRIEHPGYILHGHWASLMGGESKPGIISLDTGCVWGNKLSAWCLEEKHWFSVPGDNLD